MDIIKQKMKQFSTNRPPEDEESYNQPPILKKILMPKNILFLKEQLPKSTFDD
jgi:hypothetical protein